MVGGLTCRTAIVVAVLTVGGPVAAQSVDRSAYVGRPLADVLRDLQAQGLRILFSSELVRPDMRVAVPPTARSPRKILDQVLQPHGLEARAGPGGSLLVVRRRRPAPESTALPVSRGAIRGTVVDAQTGEPLPGVLVAVQGAGEGVVTDPRGRFDLAGVGAGPQTLYASIVGYGLARPLVVVPAGGTTDVTIPLSNGTGTYTEVVSVTADRAEAATSLAPAIQTLRSADMLDLRGVLTDDAFRAVHALAGVATGDDRRSEFSVRGSDFDHMGLSIDGVATRWSVHTVRGHEDDGSVALINGDVLEDVTLRAGAYPQERLGRTGASLDLSIREGSRAARQLRAAVSASSASLVAEGPIGDTARGSWLVSVRQSYLQWLMERLDRDGGSTSFGFTDAQAKVVFDATPAQQLSFTLVAGRSRFHDEPQVPDANSVGVGRSRAGLAALGWRSMFGDAVIVSQRFAAVGHWFENQGALGEELGHGTSADVSYRGTVAWTPRPSLLMRAGTHVQRERDQQHLTCYVDTPAGPLTGRIEEDIVGSATTFSGDVRATWTAQNGGGADLGAMTAHSSLTGETAVSPWAMGALPLGRSVTVRAGAGLSHQFPLVEHVDGTFGRSDVGAERARHLDVSIEHRPMAGLRWQVTFYDREERDMRRLQDSEARLADGEIVFPSLTPFWQNALSGSSRGVEFIVQRQAASGFTGWLGYAFGRTRYVDVDRHEAFWGDFDQRHTVNGYLQYRLSPRTSFSGKLRVGSNVPLSGYFEQRPGGTFLATERNLVRLPRYARLDLRANHVFNFQKRRLTLFAEIINVLNRTNQASARGRLLPTGRVVGTTESLFPILPSLGMMIEF